MFRRERDTRRTAKAVREHKLTMDAFGRASGNSSWDDKPASNQRLIAGKAVRTEGDPWGDGPDEAKAHVGRMATDAWKSSGY